MRAEDLRIGQRIVHEERRGVVLRPDTFLFSDSLTERTLELATVRWNEQRWPSCVPVDEIEPEVEDGRLTEEDAAQRMRLRDLARALRGFATAPKFMPGGVLAGCGLQVELMLAEAVAILCEREVGGG